MRPPRRPFYVDWEHGRWIVRVVGDKRFHFAPAGGYTSKDHARAFRDKLNDRFQRD